MANSLNGAWLQGIMVVAFIILEWKTITTILCKCVSLTELAIACGKIRHKETRGRPGGRFATRITRTQRRQESTDVNQWFIAMNLYIIFSVCYMLGKLNKTKHTNTSMTTSWRPWHYLYCYGLPAKLLIYCCQYFGFKTTPRSFLKRYGANNVSLIMIGNARSREESKKANSYSTISSDPLVTEKHERWKNGICHDSFLSSGVPGSCPLTWKRQSLCLSSDASRYSLHFTRETTNRSLLNSAAMQRLKEMRLKPTLYSVRR